MTNPSIEQYNEELKEMYDDPMYRSMIRMWGENINLGYFESPDDDLATATERCNEKLARAAGLEPGLEMLEVACGVGGGSRYAARNYGVRVVATNLSRDQLAIASDRTEKAIAGQITYEYADFHELPYADNRFDIWWCTLSMLHAVDKSRVLREAFRVLKPSGRLVLTEITVSEGLDTGIVAQISKNAHSPGLWTMSQYDRAFETIGFEVLEREDWTRQASWGWRRLPIELEKFRAEIEGEIGIESFNDTIERYRNWADAATTGQTGCIFFAMRKPMG